MTRRARGFLLTLTIAGVAASAGCTPILPDQMPSGAEARLRAGVLPDAVPAVAPGGALDVAKDHFRAGNFGYAARYYEQAVSTGAATAEAWLGLAASYDRLRRFDLADGAYIEAARRSGGSAAYHNNVGYSYLLRGEAARAERSFSRALELDPANVTVRNNLELLRDAAGGRPA